MYTALLLIWCILVIGGYVFCILNQIEPIFYLWLAFAIIGGIFVAMEGLDFVLAVDSKNTQRDANILQGKERVKRRRKNAEKQSPFSDLLSYMTIPLILCLICEYLIF